MAHKVTQNNSSTTLMRALVQSFKASIPEATNQSLSEFLINAGDNESAIGGLAGLEEDEHAFCFAEIEGDESPLTSIIQDEEYANTLAENLKYFSRDWEIRTVSKRRLGCLRLSEGNSLVGKYLCGQALGHAISDLIIKDQIGWERGKIELDHSNDQLTFNSLLRTNSKASRSQRQGICNLYIVSLSKTFQFGIMYNLRINFEFVEDKELFSISLKSIDKVSEIVEPTLDLEDIEVEEL